jgi:hypothetical protein
MVPDDTKNMAVPFREGGACWVFWVIAHRGSWMRPRSLHFNSDGSNRLPRFFTSGKQSRPSRPHSEDSVCLKRIGSHGCDHFGHLGRSFRQRTKLVLVSALFLSSLHTLSHFLTLLKYCFRDVAEHITANGRPAMQPEGWDPGTCSWRVPTPPSSEDM